MAQLSPLRQRMIEGEASWIGTAMVYHVSDCADN